MPIRIERLGFSYADYVVFADLNATLTPGLSLVTGAESCGKSTLLKLLARRLKPQSGVITGDDYSVYWADAQSDAFDQISTLEYFASLEQNFPLFDQPLASTIAIALGLEPHLNKPLYMLSTGSKRKVWIAAGFASTAQLTLIDEPYAALDGTSSRAVTELLLAASQHKTRMCLIADYQAPDANTGIRLASVIQLD